MIDLDAGQVRQFGLSLWIRSSPDAQWLFGRTEVGLATVRLDGAKAIQLSSSYDVPRGDTHGYYAASPDNKYVAYRREAPAGMWVISLDGTEHFRLRKDMSSDVKWSMGGDCVRLGSRAYCIADPKTAFRLPSDSYYGGKYHHRQLLAHPEGWLVEFSTRTHGEARVTEFAPHGLIVNYAKGGVTLQECEAFEPEERLAIEPTGFKEFQCETKLLELKVETEKIVPRDLPNHKRVLKNKQ